MQESAPQATRGNEVVGEVISANTAHFIAQCPRSHLHTPPAFGSLVKIVPNGAAPPVVAVQPVTETVDDPFADPVPAVTNAFLSDAPDGTLYALVYSASTGSAEPGRRATAYGLEEEELYQEQPQILDLLATEFAALHIGYVREGRYRAYLPPRPPRLHAPVRECAPTEVCLVTESPDLLRALLSAPGEVPTDELIAATLRHAYECRLRDFGFLVRMGKQMAGLLRDDPERLSALLRKLEP